MHWPQIGFNKNKLIALLLLVATVFSLFNSTVLADDTPAFVQNITHSFSNPYGVALDSSGNIYVADTGNNQIQKFNSSGTYITSFGSAGTGDGQFNSPRAIAVSQTTGKVFVADFGNQRIEVFNSAGVFQSTITLSPAFGPTSIALDSSDNVYITGFYNYAYIYSSAGANIGFVDILADYTSGVAVDASGNVYVGQTNGAVIKKFNSSGTYVFDTDNVLFLPISIAVDGDENIYGVSLNQYGYPAITKFDSNGDSILAFGSFGGSNGQLGNPGGIALSPDAQTIYVADTGNNRISIFQVPNNNPPVLAEVTPVSTPTATTTPSYTFSSTKAGTITYGGSCLSDTTSATGGNNTIVFNPLPEGTYSNCTITVTDISSNVSTPLTVTAFTIASTNKFNLGATVAAGTTVYAPGWATSSDRILTAHAGQYLKFSVQDTSNLYLIPDVSSMNTDTYFKIRTIVDGVEDSNVTISTTTKAVTLTSGLSSSRHQIELIVTAANITGSEAARSRWFGVANMLQLKNLTLDPGGSLLAPSGSNAVRPTYTIWKTDSLGEVATVSGVNDVSKTFVTLISNNLDWEHEHHALSGTGWVNTYIVDGQGGVLDPPLYNPTGSSTQPINAIDSTHSELVNGHLQADNLIIALGTNDVGQTSGGALTTRITDTLTYVRTIFDGQVIIILPPTQPGLNDVIEDAVDAYVTSSSDSMVHVVGVSPSQTTDLQSQGNGNSIDGTHLTAQGNVNLAAILEPLIVSALGNSSPVSISSVASSTTQTTATITWTTTRSASSTVEYGTTTGYGTATTSNALVTNHSMLLSGLSPSTTYHFRVSSTDSDSNATTSVDYTFTTSAPDTTAPVISSVASSTTATAATITWTTNENSTSTVYYGATSSYSSASSSASSVTSHTITLRSLTPSTTYHFQVASTDPSGNRATSTDYIFTTTAVPVGLTFLTNLIDASDYGGYGVGSNPLDIAFDSGGVVNVTDNGYRTITQYDSSNTFQAHVGTNLYALRSIAIDALDHVQYTLDQVVQGTRNFGGYTASMEDGKFVGPTGVAYDTAGNIYVVDSSNSRVQKFSPLGEFIDKFGTAGSGNGEFNAPTYIAVDPSGNIYVADTGNNRVQKFDSSFNYVSKFGTSGTGDGQFSGPTGITLDSTGKIYVSDSGNDRVQQFSSSGVFGSKFGTSGTGDGELDNPQGIEISPLTNYVYVADLNNHRVAVFEYPDTESPVLTSIASSTNPNSATITWSTNEGATSVVDYGTTSSYGLSSSSDALITSHSIVLTGLATSTAYHFRISSTDISGNIATSSDYVFTTLSFFDTTAPSVSITSPSNGTTTSGFLTLTASASDNVGVVGVQFKVDGANVGSEDVQSPYSIVWDTSEVSNNTHAITAVARDSAGNSTTSTAITITTANSSATVKSIFRSVAPAATGALDTGSSDSNSLTISGDAATFGSAVPNNVGVGDAVQYDSDGNGSVDAVAFIHGRSDSTHYTLKNAAGSAPIPVSSDTDWSIFRAYTSLANAEAGTENAGINSGLRNFDTFTGGKNLTTSHEQWNIALYANGTTADGGATVSGWTTDAESYIRMYTATSTSEVGTSQRHIGKWDTSKYYIGASAINVSVPYIRIDGLQVMNDNAASYATAINFDLEDENTSHEYVSNNFLRANQLGGGFNYSASGSGGNHVDVWNNIVNNTSSRGNDQQYASGVQLSGMGTGLGKIYNNTFYTFSSIAFAGSSNLVIENNIVASSSRTIGGNSNLISASSTITLDYNAIEGAGPNLVYTGDGGLTIGTHNRYSQTFTFVDPVNQDFRLASNDAGARNHGTTLSGGGFVSLDVEGQQRPPVGWDIGADEYIDENSADLIEETRVGATSTPVGITNDTTPSYTFYSSVDGTISYGGSCSSSSTNAIAGNNTITFNTLSEGTYTDCTITVTHNAVAGDPLDVSDFRVDTSAPTIVNVTSAKADGTYNRGDVITVVVTLSEAVTSSGNVTLTFETGSTDRTCAFTLSNSATGTCSYEVQSGDTSSDLDVSLIAGTVRDQAGNSLTNFAPTTNLAANKGFIIDGSIDSTLAVIPEDRITDWSGNAGYNYTIPNRSVGRNAVTDDKASGSANMYYSVGVTNGSNILTLPSPTDFQVGQGIWVMLTAGNVGGLFSTVTAVDSSSITLADNVSTALSTTTIRHDDTVALQSCINNTPTNMACYVPPGTYQIGSLIYLAAYNGEGGSNRTFKGAGPGTTTILFYPNGYNVAAFWVTGQNGNRDLAMGTTTAGSTRIPLRFVDNTKRAALPGYVGQLVLIDEANDGHLENTPGYMGNPIGQSNKVVAVGTTPGSEYIDVERPLYYSYKPFSDPVNISLINGSSTVMLVGSSTNVSVGQIVNVAGGDNGADLHTYIERIEGIYNQKIILHAVVNSVLATSTLVAENNPAITLQQSYEGVGLQDLTIDRYRYSTGDSSLGTGNYSPGNNIWIKTCLNCFVDNVESKDVLDWHARIEYSYGTVVQNSWFENSWQYNCGGNACYGVGLFGKDSDSYVVNNVFKRVRHAMLTEYGGSGNIFAYNYSTEPINEDGPNQVYLMGDIITHGGFPHMNLWEGNTAAVIRNDTVLGSAEKNTFFRNNIEVSGTPYFNALAQSTNPQYRFYALDAQAANLEMNYVGNIFGSSGLMNPNPYRQSGYSATPLGCYEEYSGYDTGQLCSGFRNYNYETNRYVVMPDARVSDTMISHGNYNYTTSQTIWDDDIPVHVLPNSMYLTSAPSWWDNSPWPGNGPDVSGYFNPNPAVTRYEARINGADTTAPDISSIASGSITSSGATIVWTTDESADSIVNFGTTTSYGSASSSATLLTSHSIVLSGLTASTTYHYQISSTDSSGNNSTSTDRTFTTSAASGGDVTAPVISSIASSTTQTAATITWTTNESATTTVSYGLTSSYGTASSSIVAATSHAYVLTGLTTATTYHFRISSWDASGNLSTSTDRTFTTASVPVTTPTLSVQSASSVSTSTATLNGTVTNDGSASSTVHGFNYGLTTSYGSIVSTTASFGSGAFNQAVTGLTPDTTYHYRAFATNGAGTGVSSDVTFTTASAPDTTSPIISSIASSTSLTTATITWTTNEAASSTVEYGATSSYGSASTSASLVTSHSITLSGLTASTTYHFRVAGADASANVSTSSDYIFTTVTPDFIPPTITPVGSSAQSSTATITWNTNEGATSQIEFGTTTTYTGSSTLDATLVTSHTAGISGLLPSTLYHYRILSKDAQNNLGTSTDLTLTTTASSNGTNTPAPTESGGGATGGGGGGSVTIIYGNNTPDTGCSAGYLFSTTTGKKCESTTDSGCLPGYLFSTTTGKSCAASSTVAPIGFAFTRDLTLNATGEDVRQLQIFLNARGFVVSATGAGSVGQETTLFGSKTQQALARFQKANGIAPAAGYFGSLTRRFIMGVSPVSAPVIPQSTPATTGAVSISVLQTLLIKLNYLPSSKNTGIFDTDTKNALIKFQANNIQKILALETDPSAFKYGEVGEGTGRFVGQLK